MQQSSVHKINLPCDTKYLAQIPRPDLHGEFLRLEQQTNDCYATFEPGNRNELKVLEKAGSGFCLSMLKYSPDSEQLESYEQLNFEGQPVQIKSASNRHGQSASWLFTGEQGQVFWFTKDSDGLFSVNKLDQDAVNGFTQT